LAFCGNIRHFEVKERKLDLRKSLINWVNSESVERLFSEIGFLGWVGDLIEAIKLVFNN